MHACVLLELALINNEDYQFFKHAYHQLNLQLDVSTMLKREAFITLWIGQSTPLFTGVVHVAQFCDTRSQ